MISVKSKIIINKMALRQLDAAAALALAHTAEQLHEDVQQAQVIPFYNGITQGEGFSPDYKDVKNGKVRLVHSTPYARRIYFNPDGLKFHRVKWLDKYGDGKEHDGNPNARDHWFEPWLPGGEKGDFCARTFKILYRRAARKAGVMK